MNKINLVFLVAAVPVIFFVLWFLSGSSIVPFEAFESGTRTVVVGNVPVSVEVVDTPRARARGLSGRASLPATGGMLFVFEELGAHGIWMKDMRFPIDIIWIAPRGNSEELTVVDIKRDARPESFPEIFYPRANARYVLELNANFTEIHGIRIGDAVRI